MSESQEMPEGATLPKTFEQALARLREINERFEAGDLPLQEAIRLCREGAELAKFCEKQLEEAEQVVKKVIEESGGVAEEDFDLGET